MEITRETLNSFMKDAEVQELQAKEMLATINGAKQVLALLLTELDKAPETETT